MKKIKVVDIKLKIVRGRPGPTEKRFQYSTLIEYFLEGKEDDTPLTMGITPHTYFFLKKVLNEDLDDLERVIYHNIRVDNRKLLTELFLENHLLNISLKKELIDTVDEVVIDTLKPVGQSGYNFSASIYLNNGQRIPNIIPSDAIVLALLGKKDIYIESHVLEEKAQLDKEFEEKMASKKGEEGEDALKNREIPKRIYT